MSLLKQLHKIQTLTLSSEVAAENFDPEYLKINPNGTLPSLVVPSLPQPIIDSHLILQYLDQSRTGSESPSLTPPDLANKATMDAIVDLMRSSDAVANLILLRARDEEEYNEKRAGPFAAYIALGQRTLEKYNSAFPNHIFYGPKAKENSVLHRIYMAGPGHERDAFFPRLRQPIANSQKSWIDWSHFSSCYTRQERALHMPTSPLCHGLRMPWQG